MFCQLEDRALAMLIHIAEPADFLNAVIRTKIQDFLIDFRCVRSSCMDLICQGSGHTGSQDPDIFAVDFCFCGIHKFQVMQILAAYLFHNLKGTDSAKLHYSVVFPQIFRFDLERISHLLIQK